MAEKKVYGGSTVGPLLYDDDVAIDDPDGDFSGVDYHALVTDGQAYIGTTPSLDEHVVRKVDLDDYVAASDFTQDGGFLVGTGAGTYQEETLDTARTSLGVGTGDSPQLAGVNIGHASDTTLSRPDAGDLSIEGNRIYRAGGTDVPVTDGGTGASTAANARTNLGLVIGTNVLAEQTIGIADDNLMEVDDADAADNDYAKFTANGLEGRSYSEIRSDLNLWVDVKSYGAIGDGSTDDTTAIQNAINAAEAGSKVVYLPAGTYRITSDLTIDTTSTTMKGAGKDSVTLSVKLADADTFTNGVIYLNSGEPSALLKDFTILFEQAYDATADATEANKLHDADGGFTADLVGSIVYNVTDETNTTIAAFVDSGELTLDDNIMASGEEYVIITNYVPAIHAVAEPRFRIKNLRIAKAYDGIDMTGNSGGASIENLELSCFNIGIDINGCLDEVYISGLRVWPFDLTGNQDDILFSAAVTGIRIKRIDGLSISDSMFINGIAIDFATGGGGGDSFTRIVNTSFDSYAQIDVDSSGHIARFSNCHFSTAADGGKAFDITNGLIQISNSVFNGAGTQSLVYANFSDADYANFLLVENCIFLTAAVDVSSIEVTATTSAVVKLNNNQFHRTVNTEYLESTIDFNSNIRGNITNNSTRDKGTEAGTFIDVAQDNYIIVTGNSVIGWTTALPGGYTTLVYANNN